MLYLGAAAGVSPWVWRAWRQGAPLLPMDRGNRLRMAGAVVLGGGVAPVLVFLGLSQARATSVSILLNLETVATAALGVWVFREHLGRLAAVGNLLVFAAGATLAFDGGFGEWVPGLMLAGAALCWGVDNHLTATIDGLPPTQSTFFKGVVAGSVNVVLGLALGGAHRITPPLVGGALLLGALSYGASIVLYIRSAQVLGATRAQMFFSSAPFFGVLAALAVLDERLTAAQGVALGLLVLGNGLLGFERHAHAHRHEAVDHEHEHSHDDGHHGHTHPEPVTRHEHRHSHGPVAHTHPHLPDLHHRHIHR